MIQASDILSIIEGVEDVKPRKVVSDLMSLYSHTNFKKAVDKIASKYDLTPLTVLKFFIKYTGTTFNHLPDGYSLKSFSKSDDDTSGGEDGESSSASSDTSGDEGDYADETGGDETGTGKEPGNDKDKEDIDFSFLK